MPTRDEVHQVRDITDGTVLGPTAISVAVPTTTVGTAADYTPGAVLSSEEYFYAKCNKADRIGAAVFANTTAAFVTTADCSLPNPVLGFIVAKSSDTDCTVQRYGECDLVFQGLTSGKRYFLGENGAVTAPPFPSDSVEFVQQVGSAISDTQLFIQPTGTVIRRDVTGGGEEMVCCSSLLHGQGNPAASVGKNDDFYIDVIANVLFGPKAAGAWPDGVSLVGPPGRSGASGPQGDVGPRGADSTVPGPPGADGALGPRGERGPAGADAAPPNTILNGPGKPHADEGQDGDYFYSTDTTTFYGPKEGGVWPPSGVQMKGQDGRDGLDGTRWYAGEGPPAADNDYPAGSYYYDRLNKQIYPPAS